MPVRTALSAADAGTFRKYRAQYTALAHAQTNKRDALAAAFFPPINRSNLVLGEQDGKTKCGPSLTSMHQEDGSGSYQALDRHYDPSCARSSSSVRSLAESGRRRSLVYSKRSRLSRRRWAYSGQGSSPTVPRGPVLVIPRLVLSCPLPARAPFASERPRGRPPS